MRLEVIIPVFNAPPERLARALASARACPEVAGIIVVDDGSATPVRAAALEGPGAPARLVRQANAGPSAARNRGLGLVAADAALFLDDDDELIPAGVAAMVRAAERSGAAGVQGGRTEVAPDGSERTPPIPEEFADGPLPEPDDVWMPVALFGTPACLVTRRALRAGVRFDESVWIQEDRDFLRRLADAGPLCVSREPAVRVHKRADGTNLTAAGNLGRRIRDHLTLLDRHLPVGGGERTARARQHWRRATAWLLKASARRGTGVDPALWDRLAGAARARGWGVPPKAVARIAVRRVWHRLGGGAG